MTIILETDGVTMIQAAPVCDHWDTVSIRLMGLGHSAPRKWLVKMLLSAGLRLLGYQPMVRILD